ncbi:MAG: sugar phosphate nucleotidyltransferase [Candidatus Daviesbacteria bacterium]|nr:sugar phosphate nucleotidyltransferase [Candidatus Daviesbacteria bacterium]
MSLNSENFYAVILAGGGGTRLWPKSRRKHPKHLLSLFGDQTLLRKSFERILPLIPVERVFIITLKDYQEEIKRQLPELPESQILIEPKSRNTALAMVSAAAMIRSKNSQAVIINLPADHIIKNDDQFRQTLKVTLEAALTSSSIVAIGIKPTFAHTGLGYIKTGEPQGQFQKGGIEVFLGGGFKEKPDLPTAQSFIDSGDYLWNAGMYAWSVNTLTESTKKYAPNLYQILENLNQVDISEQRNVLTQIYESDTENLSIDYALSEKVENLLVVPGDFNWSDVGDWKVIYDVMEKNEDGNVLITQNDNHIGIEDQNCLVETNGRLVVTIGLKDLVVVDTEDAILICDKNRTQDVKKVVEKLKLRKADQYL